MDFEDFLRAKHTELFPDIRDDELPDSFDHWLRDLMTDDLIEFANEAIRIAASLSVYGNG